MTATPSKSTLKILFLTLFLDLIGFSIIFPLFPALVQYYLQADPNNWFLLGFIKITQALTFSNDPTSYLTLAPHVIFGGLLASLYSLLQFIFAPFWGQLSDRIGRKPVLLLSISGLAISYLFWFFAASFTFLMIGRLLGGLMAGNISTVTASVGDITQKEERSKGMAVIGMAFGLGFILGPALGGLASLVQLHTLFPHVWGLNPFSFPALLAFLLSGLNLILVYSSFKETLSHEHQAQAQKIKRSNSLLKLFSPLPYKGTNLSNYANFVFLIAFSGMEFTLTFLAQERFQYTPAKNAYLFIFTGLVIALVQGGFVRRKAHAIGEDKLALAGIITLMPGFLLIGFASNLAMLYLGLGLMATGAALIIPCLTALTSLFSPSHVQGQVMGVFRSLGALARILGPLIACFFYAKWGSSMPYGFGVVLMFIPFALVLAIFKLKQQKQL